MKNKHVPFDRPPAAPIFRPTFKEFQDPLDYIQKIRPSAQKFGICKIITPKQWNPPFAVDRQTFRFRPRVQRLSEVGAHARMKNNFYRCLEAFCEYENIDFEPPMVKNEKIDVFELHRAVEKRGSSADVTQKKQWTQICRDLGYNEKAKQLCSVLKGYYDRVIQPYLDFCDKMYLEDNPELFDTVQKQKTYQGKTARTIETPPPKLTRSKVKNALKTNTDCCFKCSQTILLSLPLSPSKSNNNSMMICSNCDLKYHSKCTELQPDDIVLKNWVCKRCLKIQCQQELARLDNEVFGFSQSTCKYNLDSFANYADNFKQTYFKKKNVSLKEVEEEYWRLVAAEDTTADDVVVKYGADICSSMTSSGFPTKSTPSHLLAEKDLPYIESGWNLNNLPILRKSVFQFMPHDISGMTVPWCYVGMVFSCFCWHIEDHWSYSINYMHTGEAKTWYGIPESNADKFEGIMREEAKALFDKSPDLLHHITTQLNPGLLMKKDVEVYRADQSPGEFIVTFPRAYHAGFNQGFNFAEAVNFCPADWLEKGRLSIASYRTVKRPSVFSHSELIFKMASQLDLLDLTLIKALLNEMQIIQNEEKAARKRLLCIGNTKTSACRTERIKLENECDEFRECLLCRTTLYISGAVCSNCFVGNRNNRMTCLDHIVDICDCNNKEFVLKYRYSLDEITNIVSNVQQRLDQYTLWMNRVYGLASSEFASDCVSSEEGRVMRNVCQFIESLDVLDPNELKKKSNSTKIKKKKKQRLKPRDQVEEKPNLEELKMLLQVGKSINCPCYLLDFLEDIIDTCQKAMTMTDELLKTHSLQQQQQLKLEKELCGATTTNMKDEDDKENKVSTLSTNTNNQNIKSNTTTTIKSEKTTNKRQSKTKLNNRDSSPVPPQIEMGDKLTLNEMKLLVDKLHSLPAHVPQLEMAAGILSRVNGWRQFVKQLLLTGDLDEVLSPNKMKELIDCCDNSIVYISDCAMIQRMLKYIYWIDEAKGLLNQTQTLNNDNPLPSLSDCKKIHEAGSDLINMIEIDKMTTLSEAIEQDYDDDDEDDSDDDNDDENENNDKIYENKNGKTASEKRDYRISGWKIISDSLISCEKQLLKIIADGEGMQKKADEILNSKPGMFALFALNSLLKSAHSELRCTVPAITRLESVVEEAIEVNDRITETWHRLQQCRRLVHIDDLRALLSRTDSLCVAFDHAAQLRALVRTVDSWRDHLYSCFIKPSNVSQLPTPTLLEVLFPRPARQFRLMIARENALSTKLAAVCRLKEEREVTKTEKSTTSIGSNNTSGSNQGGNAAVSIATGRQKRGALASDDPLSVRMDNVVAFENYLKSALANNSNTNSNTLSNMVGCSSSQSVNESQMSNSVNAAAASSSSATELDFYNNYRAMCVAELEWMWSLREMNEDKASKDSGGRDIYCICRKRGTDQRGSQVMCDLCQDWLHLTCLGIPAGRDMSGRKFLCPQCERSRRPAFELILAEKRKLEQEARMLTVPEHQALCLMCQRVINFHKHTNQLFSPQTELGAAFAEYKRLFGVQAILPQTNTGGGSNSAGSGQQSAQSGDFGSNSDQLMGGLSSNAAGVSGKQSRKTPHGKCGTGSNAPLASVTSSGLATSGSAHNLGSSSLMSHSGSANVANLSLASLPNNSSNASNTLGHTQPLSAREAKAGIAKLRASLSDEARRELEEIYIELCLLEVTQPSITWVWKLYHSLIVDDEDDLNIENFNDDDDDDDVGRHVDDDIDDDSRMVDTELTPGGPGGLDIHHRTGDSSDDYDLSRLHKRLHPPSHHHSHNRQHHQYRRTGESNSSSYLDEDDDDDDDETGALSRRRHPYHHQQQSNKRSVSDRMEYMKSLLASKRKGLEKHRSDYVGVSVGGGGGGGEREKFAFKRKLPINMTNSGANNKRGSGNSYMAATTINQHNKRNVTNIERSRMSMSNELNDDDDDVIHLDKAMNKAVKRTSNTRNFGKSIGSMHRQIYNEDSDEPTATFGSMRHIKSAASISPNSSIEDNNCPSTSKSHIRQNPKRGRKPTSNSISNEKESGSIKQSKRKKKSSNNDGGRVCNDDCAANECIQHTSDIVNWVACDKCDLWFHWLCLGINSEEQIPNRFLCPSCIKGEHYQTPSSRSRKKSSVSACTTNTVGTTDLESNTEQDSKEGINKRAATSIIGRQSGQTTNRKRKSSSKFDDTDDNPMFDTNDDNEDDDDDDDDDDDLHIELSTDKRKRRIKGPINPTTKQRLQSSSSSAMYQNLSPPPPFLQPECCVHEEVEIGYACKSDESET